MAIVKMKRFIIIGLDTDRRSVLDKLANLGTIEVAQNIWVPKGMHKDMQQGMQNDMQIEDALSDSALAPVRALAPVSVTDSKEEISVMNAIEEKLALVKECLDALVPYDRRKKSLFTVKRDLNETAFKLFEQKKENIYKDVKKVLTIKGENIAIKTEENRLRTRFQALEPWTDLPFDLDDRGTKNTTFIMGTLPEKTDIYAFNENLLTEIPECSLQQLAFMNRLHYCWFIFHNSVLAEGLEFLKKNGFSAAEFNEITKSAEYNISALKERLAELEAETSENKKLLSILAENINDIEVLSDYLGVELDKLKAGRNMLRTKNAFAIEGWIPARIQHNLDEVSNNFICHIELRDPEEGEDVPTLLDNPSLIRPFEAVTEMYSLPKANGIDPNLFMAPFFFILFGIMLGDAAYGIILSLGTALAIKLWGPQGTSGKVVKLLCLCGISTTIWGTLFGSWFGDLFPVISGGKFNIKALWFNPMEEPVKMLLLSFIIGGIHIVTGMFLNAWIMIRDGDFMGAVYDVFSWIILLVGLAFLPLGGTFAVVGKYMAITGFLIILLFAGRTKKNFLKRIFSGLGSLYSISGYLSDVLSYSRLLALGLATGVIASVINTMGAMFGKSIIGIISLVILIIFGTIFNVALNVLGSFVHTSRLQYIEFFGKFYEGGGRAFAPLGSKTKYVKFINGGI